MPPGKRGSLDSSFTLNIDLAETILGAAQVKPDELMQGRDISDLYLIKNSKNAFHNSATVEQEPWREEFFYEFPTPDGRFMTGCTAFVRKEWKFINWPQYTTEQLFDLKNDPLEMNDLINSTEHKGLIDEMRKRHDEYVKDIGFEPNFHKYKDECNIFHKEYRQCKEDC